MIRFQYIDHRERVHRSFMPRSHIHDPPRRFHYGSNPTDDPGNDNIRSPIWMHYASTTTYVYGCNTEIYGLIRIVTDDAGSYPWLILRQILECVTWALQNNTILCNCRFHCRRLMFSLYSLRYACVFKIHVRAYFQQSIWTDQIHLQ